MTRLKMCSYLMDLLFQMSSIFQQKLNYIIKAYTRRQASFRNIQNHPIQFNLFLSFVNNLTKGVFQVKSFSLHTFQ